VPVRCAPTQEFGLRLHSQPAAGLNGPAGRNYDGVTISITAAKYRQRDRAGPKRARGVERSSKVTCRDMDDVISSRSGDSLLEPQPAEHLIHCEGCRGLARLLDKADNGLRPSESCYGGSKPAFWGI
jgi:hypothetical protein